ncbi:MAG: Cof-type HAD-IIB family hydrolase [Solobacterium sp.]|nr:Cof-type HAD-IIB family hydrolase [Solobacterium sp.]
MLYIRKTSSEDTLYYDLNGRIDSVTAVQFENEIGDIPPGTKEIVFDCARLDFISSSGLRVLLMLKKKVGNGCKLTAVKVNHSVQNVFKLTGFGDIITVSNELPEDDLDIQAAFFDVDGTLYSHSTSQVPESTRAALAVLHQKGIKLVICTGRSLEELSKLPVMDMPWDGYLTLNGNLCLDENKNMFAGNPIDSGEVDILVRIFQASRIPFVLIGEENRYINYVDDVVIDTQASTKGTIPDIGEYKGEDIYQCLAFVADKDRIMLEDMLDECTITSWNKTGIDIISKSGGKAAGIEMFIDEYHLRRGQTIAFGDGQNDIDMIRYAGIGVAMGNGVEALKSAADYVTTDIDDNGISNALKHLGLIP